MTVLLLLVVNILRAQLPCPTPLIQTQAATCAYLCDGKIMITLKNNTLPFQVHVDDKVYYNVRVIDSLCPGTYMVRVSNFLCPGSPIPVPVTSVDQPSACDTCKDLKVTYTKVNAMKGLCDGEAELSMSGGTGPFQITWSNGANTAKITNLCPGTYYYTVYDQTTHCIFRDSVRINERDPDCLIIGDLEVVTAHCLEVCDGKVLLASKASFHPPLMVNNRLYEDLSGNSPILDSLCVGTYSITIVDVFGCKLNKVVEIKPENASCLDTCRSFKTTADGGMAYLACNASATVYPAGGSGNYSYQWNDPGYSITPTVNDLCPGTYSVVVTDNVFKCKRTDSVMIIHGDPGKCIMKTGHAVLSGASSATACDGAAYVYAYDGTGTYSYQWSNGNTSAMATNLCAGMHTVTVRDLKNSTDYKCERTDTIYIPVEPGNCVSVGFESKPRVCGNLPDGRITLYAEDATGPYTYRLYRVKGGVYTVTTSVDSAIFNNLDQGEYYARITDNGRGCGGWAHIYVEFDTTGCRGLPNCNYVLSVRSRGASCAEKCDAELFAGLYHVSNNGTRTSIQGEIVVWDMGNGNTIPGDRAQGICRGDSFAVKVTYGHCTFNGAGVVGYKKLVCDPDTTCQDFSAGITVVASPANNQCNGVLKAYAAGGSGNYTYNWGNGNTSYLYEKACQGSAKYTVIVTDLETGCSDTAQITGLTPGPDRCLEVSSSSRNPKCDSINDGEFDVFVSNGTSPFTYTFYFDNDSTVSTSSVSSHHYGTLGSGEYLVKIIDAAGCFGYAKTRLSGGGRDCSLPNVCDYKLTLAATAPTCKDSCNGSATAELDMPAAAAYTWKTGDEKTGTGPLIPLLCGGVYYEFTVIAGACEFTAGGSLVKPLTDCEEVLDSCQDFKVGIDTLFLPSEGECNGVLAARVAGGSGDYSYYWGPGETSYLFEKACLGTRHTVVVTDNRFLCSDSAWVIGLPVSPKPPCLTLSHEYMHPACSTSADGFIKIKVSGDTGPFQYQLDTNGVKTTITSSVDTILYPNLKGGNYDITISGQNCSGFLHVQLNPGPSCDSNLCPYVFVVTETESCPDTCTGKATARFRLPFTYGGSVGYTDTIIGTNVYTEVGGYTNANNAFWQTNDRVHTGYEIKGLCPGSVYTVTASMGACTYTSTSTIGYKEDSCLNELCLKLDTALLPASCPEICNGLAAVSASGGSGRYMYLWSTGEYGEGMDVLEGLCANKLYQVMVIDMDMAAKEGLNACSFQTLTFSVGASQTMCSKECGPATLQSKDNKTTAGLKSGLIECCELRINLFASSASCLSAKNGRLLIDADGGVAPYQFNWSNGSGASRQFVTPGYYTVIVTDAAGNSASVGALVGYESPVCEGEPGAEIDVKGVKLGIEYIFIHKLGVIPSTLDTAGLNTACAHETNLLFIQPLCPTDSTGIINVDYLTDGSSAVTYRWSDLSTESLRDSLLAGHYQGTASDANGCATRFEVGLTPACKNCNDSCNDFEVDINPILAPSPGKCDGVLAGSARGGSGDYTMTWTAGDNDYLFDKACKDVSYTLIVTDNRYLCADTLSYKFTTTETRCLTTTYRAKHPDCDSLHNGYIETRATGGTAPYDFSVYKDGHGLVNYSNLSQINLNNLSSGNYDIVINDEPSNCFAWAHVELNEVSPVCDTALCDMVLMVDGYESCPDTCTGRATASFLMAHPMQVTQFAEDPLLGTGWHGFEYETPAVIPAMTSSWTSNDGKTGTGPNFNGLCPGSTFQVTATSGSCSYISGGTIGFGEDSCKGERNCIEITNLNVQNATCGDICNGQANATVEKGSGNYVYFWSTGDYGESQDWVEGLCPNTTYRLVVVDQDRLNEEGYSTCASDTISFVVASEQPLCDTVCISDDKDDPCCELEAALSSSRASCPGAKDGVLAVAAAGGVPPYLFRWSNGSGNRVQYVFPGYYTVVISDARGKSVTAGISVGSYALLCDDANPEQIGEVEVLGVPVPVSDVYANLMGDAELPNPTPLGDEFGYCDAQQVMYFKQPDCLTDENGQIDLFFYSGGGPDPSYQWADGPAERYRDSVGAKAYSCIATDATRGCAGKFDVTLTPACDSCKISCKDFNVDAEVMSHPSDSSCNGLLRAIATGGSGNYSFFWEENDTSAVYTKACPDTTYRVVIRDTETGCVDSAYAVLTGPADDDRCLSVSYTAKHPKCDESADGKIKVTISGGSAPYGVSLYSMDNDQFNLISTNTITYNNLPSGYYFVHILDSACSGFAFVRLKATQADCNGAPGCEGELEVTVTGATCPDSCDGKAVAVLRGVYTAEPVEVINDPDDPVFIPLDELNPVTGQVIIPAQVNWQTSDDRSESNDTILGLCAKTSFVVHVTSGACYYTSGASVGYESDTCPECVNPITVNIHNSSSCIDKCDAMIDVSAVDTTASYTWAWTEEGSDSVISDTSFIIGLCAGNYSLFVTKVGGCTQEYKFVISVIDSTPCCDSAWINGPDTVRVCRYNNVVVLSASGGDGYRWMPGGSTRQTIIVRPEIDTRYRVYILQEGCENDTITDYVFVKVVQRPNMQIAPIDTNSMCLADDVSITVCVVAAPEYMTAYTTDETGLGGNYQPIDQPDPDFNQYIYSWTAPPDRYTNPLSRCTQYLVDADKRENKLTVMVTDTLSGCQFQFVKTIKVYPFADTTIQTEEDVCLNDTVPLTARILNVAGDPVEDYVISWVSSDLGMDTVTSGTDPLEVIIPNVEDDYQITATITNSYGCSYDQVFTLHATNTPNFTFSGFSYSCEEETMVLSVSGFDYYHWRPEDGTQCLSPSCDSVKLDVTGTSTDYTVFGYKGTCRGDTTITIYPKFALSDDDPYELELTETHTDCQYTFTATAGFSSYRWTILLGGDTYETTTTANTLNYTFPSTGEYQVSVEGFTDDCEKKLARILVDVKHENCDCEP